MEIVQQFESNEPCTKIKKNESGEYDKESMTGSSTQSTGENKSEPKITSTLSAGNSLNINTAQNLNFLTI